MYVKKYYYWNGGMQVSKYSVGRQGAGGIPRGKRKKATPEDVARQNRTNRVNKMTMIIRRNFKPGDFHMVLTMRRELQYDYETEKKLVRKFLRQLSNAYKRLGETLKWILVTEVGKRGGIHHHLVINNIHQTVELVAKYWDRGRARYTPLDNDWDYKELANYLLKQAEQSYVKESKAYSHSRNMDTEEKKEQIKAMKWREEPKVPEGYYLDKSSLFEGVNPITGKLYQTYTLFKTKIGGNRSG